MEVDCPLLTDGLTWENKITMTYFKTVYQEIHRLKDL